MRIRPSNWILFTLGLWLLGSSPAIAQSASTRSAKAGQECWTSFRGDQALSGVASADIPTEPELLWEFPTGSQIKAAPVACDGIIVISNSSGSIYGITDDGKLKWKISTDNGVEAPALIVGGTVYAGDLDGKLYAIDLQKGTIRWTYKADNSIMGAPSYYEKDGKQVVLAGSYDYYLHGVDANTGKGLWKYETDNFINGSCALWGGMAVFGGCDGRIHLVDALTGKVRSSMEISTYVASSAAVAGTRAFVGDYDGQFSAVDLLAEEVAWSFKPGEAPQPFLGSPSLGKEHVFIGNRDKYLYCLNRKDGQLVWKYQTGDRVDASPVLIRKKASGGSDAGARVLAANMRGDLFLLEASTGKENWSYELGSAVSANPAVTGERIYVAAEDGTLYCFGKK